MAALPELPGGFPAADLLSAAHLQRLEAECRQREKVVGVLGLGLAVKDLSPRALDLVIDIQLSPLEIDGLPGEAQNLTTTQAEAEHQDPGGDQMVISGGGIGEELARLGDEPRLDPTATRLRHLHEGCHVLADRPLSTISWDRSVKHLPGPDNA
jgi:hypothetical protein